MFASRCANAYPNTDSDAHANVDSMRRKVYTNTTSAFDPRTETIGIRLPSSKIALVFVRLDPFASRIVSANQALVSALDRYWTIRTPQTNLSRP